MSKRVDELVPGDVFEIAGHYLHDDLGGLHCKISVVAVATDGDDIKITHIHPNGVVWLKPDLRLRILTRGAVV